MKIQIQAVFALFIVASSFASTKQDEDAAVPRRSSSSSSSLVIEGAGGEAHQQRRRMLAPKKKGSKKDDNEIGSSSDDGTTPVASPTSMGPSSRDETCSQYTAGVKAMFAGSVFPQNLEILEGGLLPEIFVPEVKGRAQPLGTFSGFSNTLEYFYALTLGDYLEEAALGGTPKFVVVGTDFRYIACDIDQSLGVFSGSLHFGIPGVDSVGTVPDSNRLHFTGGARFNKDGKVCSYELNLNRLGMFAAASNNETKDESIQKICLAIQFSCTGDNLQYDDYSDCVNFMNSIDYGSFDNGDLNSVNCRRLHAILALSRPDAHCSHTGKEGGGKCIERDYTNVTAGDYLTGIDVC